MRQVRVAGVIGAIAEFEHALMSERTRDGLEAVRARGRTGGQKPKLTARQAKIAQDMYDEKGEDGRRRYTVAEIAAEFGVTRPTIHRHLQAQADAGPPARLARDGPSRGAGDRRTARRGDERTGLPRARRNEVGSP